jgi:ADP-heptose:LPS heptosyltransferase
VAYQASRWHFWSPWLIADWVPREAVSGELSVYEQRRSVLAACGFTLQPARFELSLPPAAKDWAAKAVPSGAIHLSINASAVLKEWPLDHWISLAQELLRAPNAVLVATGSSQPREQERLQALAKAAKNERLRLLPAGLSIERLAAALHRCELHVGADSGVLHLAMALGVPTVSLFREYPERVAWLPRGDQHRHLSAPCACVNQKAPRCEGLGKAVCLETISPDRVAALVAQLMNTKGREGLASGRT